MTLTAMRNRPCIYHDPSPRTAPMSSPTLLFLFNIHKIPPRPIQLTSDVHPNTFALMSLPFLKLHRRLLSLAQKFMHGVVIRSVCVGESKVSSDKLAEAPGTIDVYCRAERWGGCASVRRERGCRRDSEDVAEERDETHRVVSYPMAVRDSNIYI